jgi:hypothetical protein
MRKKGGPTWLHNKGGTINGGEARGLSFEVRSSETADRPALHLCTPIVT